MLILFSVVLIFYMELNFACLFFLQEFFYNLEKREIKSQ